MRFLVDAQLPIGLARMLEQHGHESKHVDDLNMMQASDRDIGYGPSRITASLSLKMKIL